MFIRRKRRCSSQRGPDRRNVDKEASRLDSDSLSFFPSGPFSNNIASLTSHGRVANHSHILFLSIPTLTTEERPILISIRRADTWLSKSRLIVEYSVLECLQEINLHRSHCAERELDPLTCVSLTMLSQCQISSLPKDPRAVRTYAAIYRG